MLTEFVKVATVGDVPENGMIGVKAGADDILLARIGEEYFALDGWCSHAAGLLCEGYLHPETCEVECPIHEGMFNLKSGGVTNPPAEEDVTAYAVRVEGGDILVGPRA
jgi:nitrite reductase/ring-hydroxylating ferredoxin subunit